MCNHPFRLRSWKQLQCVPHLDTFGSVAVGDGAITIGFGPADTGGLQLAGITTFAGAMMATGAGDIAPNAMKATAGITGSMIAAKP